MFSLESFIHKLTMLSALFSTVNEPITSLDCSELSNELLDEMSHNFEIKVLLIKKPLEIDSYFRNDSFVVYRSTSFGKHKIPKLYVYMTEDMQKLLDEHEIHIA